MPNVWNTKYNVLGSVCPRLSFPGHVVPAGRQMSRSSTIDGGVLIDPLMGRSSVLLFGAVLLVKYM